MTLHIIKLRRLWFTLSGLLVVASVAILAMYPPKFGIDFTGGSLMEVEFVGERPEPVLVSETIAGLGLGESVAQTVGEKEMLIRLKTLDETTHQQVLSALVAGHGEMTEHRFESVGPTVGDELRSKAVWSIGLVLIGIALYVAYAFRKVSRPVSSWKYGLVTLVVGLLHDVLLPLAAFGLLGRYQLVEINSAFVAAILTVLGFSVHDTIVVFDRIRENLQKTSGSFEDIVERSVNETLSRSINTSLTTLVPMIAIYFLGGESLRYFSLTLIIGLLAGTYSSICLAAPMLVALQKKAAR